MNFKKSVGSQDADDRQVIAATSDDRLAGSFDFLPEAFCVLHPDGHMKQINTVCEGVLGYSVEELLVTPFIEFIHPDDQGSALADIESQRSGHGIMQLETRWRHGDGSFRYLSWRVTGAEEGGLLYASARDITEYRQIEGRVSTRDHLNTLLLDSLPHAAMLIRKDRTVIAANRIALEVGAKVGHPCWQEFAHSECISQEDKDLIDSSCEPVCDGVHCTFCIADQAMESGVPMNDPSVHSFGRIWDTYWIPLDDEIFLHYAYDVTERQKSEDTLRVALDSGAERQAETASLLDCAHAVLEDAPFEVTARHIFDAAKKLTGARSGYVALLNEHGDENEVLFLDSGGMPCSVDKSLPMPIRGLRGEAYRESQVVYDNSFMKSDWVKHMPPGHMTLDNVLFSPLVVGGKTVGILGLANKREGFVERDAEMARAYGELAAMALRNTRSLASLEESRELFKAVMDCLPVGIAVNSIEPAVTFEYMNDAFIKAYRTTAEALADPDCFWDVVYSDPVFREEIKSRVLSDCASGDPERMHWDDIPITRNGEKTTFVSASNTPVKDRPLMVSTVSDVTERKELEGQLRQSEKMQAVGQLAGGIAHDFNNQLTGILGYADILTKRLEDETLNRYATNVKIGAQHAAALISQLLAFSRKGKNLSVPVSIHRVVTEVTDILEHSIDKRIKIRQTLNANPATTTGDPNQLQNAILNIALNARDAMPDGGELIFETGIAELDEDFRKLHSYEMDPGNYIRIAIIDDGIGMDTETQKHAFEPFYTTKGVGEGTGMGLASAYGTIKNHRGGINICSEVGHGTTFHIYLPLAEDTHDEVDNDDHGTPVTGTARILVVDDEEMVRDLASEILTSLGYTLTTCKDGKEAVEHYKESWDEIDLVILDMVMPEMSGKDAFLAMQKINPTIRAILSSGYALEGEAQNILNDGVMGFVGKPYEIHELSEKVAQVLRGGD